MRRAPSSDRGLFATFVPDRSLVILSRKFVVVIIGGLVYGEPKFAAVFTAISLFVAFVLHKAYSPYRTSTDPLAALGASGASELRLPDSIAKKNNLRSRQAPSPRALACTLYCH